MRNLILLLLVSFVTAASAQNTEVYHTKSGAINGYDPVAYFNENKSVKGNPEIAYTYKGADWHFSTIENRNAFKENPVKYTPQYGGYCAYGLSKGYKAPTQPDAFTIVDGKLYLNYNRQVQAAWSKDQAALIKQADSKWPEIKNAKPE